MADQQGEDQSTSPNYMFVTSTSEGKTKNNSLRRSHVMHSQIKTRTQPNKSYSLSPPQVLPSLLAGKRSFRLARREPQAQSNLRSPPPPPLLAPAQRPIRASMGVVNPSATNQVDLSDPPQRSSTKVEDLSADEKQTLLRLSTSPLLLFGNSRLDSLGVLPMKLTPWDEVLVDRFCHYEKWPWCPVSGQTLWSPFALSDELAFSATMYSWSVGIGSRLMGKSASAWLESNPDIMQHRLSTISLVNARISDPEEAVKDQTIAAVTVVAHLELLYGTREAASQHMNGLKALVEMRGGFKTFVTPLQLLLQRLLSWVDIVYSQLFEVPPMFPPAEIWDITWYSRDQMTLPGSPLGLLPRGLVSANIPHDEVLEALQDVRELCEAQKARPMSGLQDHERMLRCDMFLKIESRLNIVVKLISRTATDCSSPRDRTGLVWKATALSALVFVHHFLRGNPLRHRQYGVLVPMLQETLLEMTPDFQELAFARPLLFWILSVACVTSNGLSCHDWLVEKLSMTCSSYLMDWRDLRLLLIGFLWTGSDDDDKYASIWRMLDHYQGNLQSQAENITTSIA
ncbi:hypothetical protein LTR84_004395 [Exophiala bonariae]|uniref:Transcription factor domain-containing protein n=1 Tax=Exophiala bonariae TaxID=1690606 RepID=A0AAV9N806_9EURO|nr:hypothetical protein LTR84_004395 [Exophiala bonariae]